MKRWIRCVPGFVMLVVFSIFCAQTVMAAETGTTTDPFQQKIIKPEPEIDIIKEPESVYYRVVVDDRIEGAQVECPNQAAAGEIVPVLVRADGDHSIRSVVVNYYDVSFEGHQIEMDPLMEDEDGVHYEFIMPDADVTVLVMTEVLHNVTVLKSDGGTVTASHDRAGFNDSVALTAEPEKGYRFASWEVYEESGSQIGVRSDDTFLMGLEAVTVRAVFEKLNVDYSITLTQSGEGTIVSSGERASAGETVTVTPSAQSGYRLERITVTANTPGAGVVLEDTEEKESYSFTMPEGDVTVHVQFDKITDHVVRVIWGDDVADRPQQVIVQLQKKDGNCWVYGGTSVSLSDENVWTSRISLEQQSMPEGEWRFRLINDQEGTVHAPDDEDADGAQAIYSVTREGSIDLYAVYQHVDYAISDTGTEIRLRDPSIEMTFPVQIVWEEGDDLRPEQITVALQKQSAEDQPWVTVETLELSGENNWNSEFPPVIEERGSSYRVRELMSSDEAVEDGSTVTYDMDEDGETVPHTWQNSHTLDYTYNDAGMTILTKTPLDVPLSEIAEGSWVIPKLEKVLQPMTVKAAKKAVSFKKLKKKAIVVAPLKVKGAQGTLSYKITGGSKKSKKALKLNAKNGKITVKKKTKKGTYKIAVTVKASGNENCEAGSKKVAVVVKVK